MTKVAVVGCGHWGKNLIRNFHELGALAAISDTDWPRATALARERDVPALSFADILMTPGVDGVVLATPAETHGSLALRCIDAGKDVFVEKPLALDIAEAERMKACADERDSNRSRRSPSTVSPWSPEVDSDNQHPRHHVSRPVGNEPRLR